MSFDQNEVKAQESVINYSYSIKVPDDCFACEEAYSGFKKDIAIALKPSAYESSVYRNKTNKTENRKQKPNHDKENNNKILNIVITQQG